MVHELIKEIELALDSRLYLVAMNTALILPDICGKAEYPEMKTAQRYKKWYQEHIGQYEQSFVDQRKDLDLPYLSAEVVYQLRCSLLHQGDPHVGKEKTGIDRFVLCAEDKRPFGLYVDKAFVKNSGAPEKEYQVNVRRLCFLLCRAAENCYKANREKFDFFRGTILRLDPGPARESPGQTNQSARK